ncbi:hypothetical protein LTR36_009685 [Oleoguttula mirabilis]|uniref:Peroxin 26 n=1 Tax=Oleoguttula mirabilis TaxID=1507867 RepID=A0AAV9J5G6_9PEZI|nr:hypothetical protein LTR36_009685 [Oleoguttula mirabilis]
MAATETMTYQDSLDSQYLSSSLSNLSRSRSTNSLIVRTYKQATQLYLTKRFKEALETLEPIITPQRAQRDDATNGDVPHGAGATAAPVAQCSKGTRTKVWVFYLSLLHAIIELGPEEGKLAFGSSRWRQLANKAREGTIWEEIVQAGYGGIEGDVDADVVVNLATLLLGHMATQTLNQQRLETWLATGGAGDGGQHVAFADGTISPAPNGGTSSPKALATRLKILELYTLHVLPANEEWQYAREFIEMNDTLDEERREVFVHALQQLREEKDGTAVKERELAARREREMEEQRQQEEAGREQQARQEDEKQKAAEVQPQRASSVRSDASIASSSNTPVNGTTKPAANSQSKLPAKRASPSKASKKPPAPPPTLYRRASSALNNIQHMIMQASRNMTGNSMAMFRLLMFMVAFLVLVARRDLRLKLKRVLEDGWTKVRRTVGMGVKVSYI